MNVIYTMTCKINGYCLRTKSYFTELEEWMDASDKVTSEEEAIDRGLLAASTVIRDNYNHRYQAKVEVKITKIDCDKDLNHEIEIFSYTPQLVQY